MNCMTLKLLIKTINISLSKFILQSGSRILNYYISIKIIVHFVCNKQRLVSYVVLTSKCNPSYPIDAFQITLTQKAYYDLSINTTKDLKDSYLIELIFLEGGVFSIFIELITGLKGSSRGKEKGCSRGIHH
jgi:hypothetical protein